MLNGTLFITPRARLAQREFYYCRDRLPGSRVDFIPIFDQIDYVEINSDRIFLYFDDQVIDVFSYEKYAYFPYNYSPIFTSIKNNIPEADHFRLLFEQWHAVSFYLEEHLNTAICVNAPRFARLVSNKPYCYAKLHEYGLRVPRTIFTNSADRVASFFNGQKFIEKVAGFHNTVAEGVLAPTSVRTVRELDENKAAVAQAPSLFQEFVEKEVELRIFVFGQHSIAVSQRQIEKSVIDYRFDNIENIAYEITDKYKPLEKSLSEFLQENGVDYAAIDVAIPSGASMNEYYVLDVNPHGEWSWIPDDDARKEFSRMFLRLLEKK